MIQPILYWLLCQRLQTIAGIIFLKLHIQLLVFECHGLCDHCLYIDFHEHFGASQSIDDQSGLARSGAAEPFA